MNRKAKFARGIARAIFKRDYTTDRDLAIARSAIRLIAERDKQIRGSGYGIRAWRAETPKHRGAGTA
jgi:hypothetical protein